jgi:hypothetical protein
VLKPLDQSKGNVLFGLLLDADDVLQDLIEAGSHQLNQLGEGEYLAEDVPQLADLLACQDGHGHDLPQGGAARRGRGRRQ